jgi:hypothetical protein
VDDIALIDFSNLFADIVRESAISDEYASLDDLIAAADGLMYHHKQQNSQVIISILAHVFNI